MIFRFILLFFLLYLFFTLLNLYLFRRKRPPNPRRSGGASQAEEMVLDPQCKSYLPKSEAMLRGGEYFCSDECARLYLAGRPSN